MATLLEFPAPRSSQSTVPRIAHQGIPRTPPPLPYRRDESVCTHFRAGRFFTVGHEWYTLVRGGETLGPYLYRAEAELALVRHVAECYLHATGGIAEIFSRGEQEASEFEILIREVIECWEQRNLRSDNSAYVWILQRLEAINGTQGHSEIESRVLQRLLDELE